MSFATTVRSRRRRASALVAMGAAVTMTAAILAPAAPASASGLGDLNSPLTPACEAGDSPKSTGLSATADCTGATPSIVAAAVDSILGLVAPSFPLSLAGFNGAIANSGLRVGLPLVIPGKATIRGTGYSTAVVVLGGEATASSDYFLSGSVAVAALGGKATADSVFGVSVATAVGRPQALLLPELSNSASSNALPFGVAIANSMNLAAERHASATALGGIASASSAIDGSEKSVCTALYGSASVTDKNGKNVKSCTSVLFVFQQSQKGGDPVVYAIKNPFDVGLVSPYGDDIADFLSKIPETLGVPDGLADVMAGKFVPEFQSDIVRISFVNGVPQLGTDLPQWLGSLFGTANTSSNALARKAAAPKALTAKNARVSHGSDDDASSIVTNAAGADAPAEQPKSDLNDDTVDGASATDKVSGENKSDDDKADDKKLDEKADDESGAEKPETVEKSDTDDGADAEASDSASSNDAEPVGVS